MARNFITGFKIRDTENSFPSLGKYIKDIPSAYTFKNFRGNNLPLIDNQNINTL